MPPFSHLRLVFLVVILGASWPSKLAADRDIAPRAGRVFSSSDGAYFLIATATNERRETWLWTMFAVDERGLFKEFWSADGVYARQILPADDGYHIACVETWPHGRPSKDVPVITIYDVNRLVKTIRLSDIVQNIDDLPTSSAHFRWLDPTTAPFTRDNNLFLTTTNGNAYVINLKDGLVRSLEREQ